MYKKEKMKHQGYNDRLDESPRNEAQRCSQTIYEIKKR